MGSIKMNHNQEWRQIYAQQVNNVFKDTLSSWKDVNSINELYESGHSPIQVIKLWLYETNCLIKHQQVSILQKNKLPFKNMLESSLARRLKKYINYSKEQHRKHLITPQAWKLKFNNLDKTQEEVNELVKKQLQDWAYQTHEKRRKSGVYDASNTVEYWQNKLNITQDEAKNVLQKHKQIKSPFSKEHWIKKGFSQQEAEIIIKKYHVNGGIAATKIQGSIAVSKLEIAIYKSLLCEFPELVSQFNINDVFAYDICLPSKMKIIEVNGSYWHADPRIFTDNDKCINGCTVSQIRSKDAKKIGYAKHFGYDVLVIWELDWCKSKLDVLNLMRTFLL